MEDIKMGTCNMLERRAKSILKEKAARMANIMWIYVNSQIMWILCEYMW